MQFRGEIAGAGSTSGVRLVVGRWRASPYGGFADVMIERPDGHRVLLAPDQRIADFVAATYTFDEIRVGSVSVAHRESPSPGSVGSGTVGALPDDRVRARPIGRPTWSISGPGLGLEMTIGPRTSLGRALRLVPRALAEVPTWTLITDPIARVGMRGVRTRGTARAGRREYYGATGIRSILALSGAFDGVPLGSLAPVDPPCAFGFSSTPRRPTLTSVVTTIVDVRQTSGGLP